MKTLFMWKYLAIQVMGDTDYLVHTLLLGIPNLKK